jgi:hypothetical protein
MPRGWRRRKAQRGRAGPRRRCVPPPPGDPKGFESNVFGNPKGRITLRPFGFSSFSSRSTPRGASHQKGSTVPSLPLLVASRARTANLSRAPTAPLSRQSKGLPDRDQDRPSVFHHRDRQAQPPITFGSPGLRPAAGPARPSGPKGWVWPGAIMAPSSAVEQSVRSSLPFKFGLILRTDCKIYT